MRYISILDRQNLSNSLFITKFAQALRSHKDSFSLVLHGDSEYTEELIQTGMMREDAAQRCTRELNRRLVALLADEGVATVGLNGYQRDTVLYDGEDLSINTDYINSLPEGPVLLLSNLARQNKNGNITSVPVTKLANRLATVLQLDEIIAFTQKTEDSSEIIPQELENAPFSFRHIDISRFRDVSNVAETPLTTP